MKEEDVIYEMYTSEGISPKDPLFWHKTLQHYKECKNCDEWSTIENIHEHEVCLTCYLDHGCKVPLEFKDKVYDLHIYLPSCHTVIPEELDAYKWRPNELSLLKAKVFIKISNLINNPIESFVRCKNCTNVQDFSSIILIQSISGLQAFCSDSCLKEWETTL